MNVQRRLRVASATAWTVRAHGWRAAPVWPAMGGRRGRGPARSPGLPWEAAADAAGSLVPVYCTHQPGRDVNAIEIRYFAAAAEAAGTTHERLEVAPGTTLAALREALAGRGTQMARVIGLSSYLVNSLSAPADGLQELADGDRVDVLPPFAGG